jgi:hypothetical protein
LSGCMISPMKSSKIQSGNRMAQINVGLTIQWSID